MKLLREMANRTGIFHYGRAHMVLAFQKEVAERLLAPVAHVQRSRLSVLCQTYTSVSDHFVIEGKDFVPPPKVLAVASTVFFFVLFEVFLSAEL